MKYENYADNSETGVIKARTISAIWKYAFYDRQKEKKMPSGSTISDAASASTLRRNLTYWSEGRHDAPC